ncbi:hypothetical protein JHK87_011507 [Glycine soja]|nr:hypothetical protein JHK87_011507 [Glycine soja]
MRKPNNHSAPRNLISQRHFRKNSPCQSKLACFGITSKHRIPRGHVPRAFHVATPESRGNSSIPRDHVWFRHFIEHLSRGTGVPAFSIHADQRCPDKDVGVEAVAEGLGMQLNAGSEVAGVGDAFEGEGEDETVGGEGGLTAELDEGVEGGKRGLGEGESTNEGVVHGEVVEETESVGDGDSAGEKELAEDKRVCEDRFCRFGRGSASWVSGCCTCSAVKPMLLPFPKRIKHKS